MKKKMSAEERAEFKNGKYMGGPAEEKAEKKKKPKKMAMGGPANQGPMDKRNDNPMAAFNRFDQMPGRRMGQKPLQPGLPPYTGAAPTPMPVARPGSMPMKTMKTGGLVKGAGCAARGVKTPRMK